jgi:hypothetical protein
VQEAILDPKVLPENQVMPVLKGVKVTRDLQALLVLLALKGHKAAWA